MPFTITLPTRHTDTFASTGYVHGGVLIALTELAYAEFEAYAGYTKPDHIVSVQRESRIVYQMPLPWRAGVTIEVNTSEVNDRGFEQEFSLRSAVTGRPVAVVVHKWTWIDTNTNRRVPIPEDVQAKLRNA